MTEPPTIHATSRPMGTAEPPRLAHITVTPDRIRTENRWIIAIRDPISGLELQLRPNQALQLIDTIADTLENRNTHEQH